MTLRSRLSKNRLRVRSDDSQDLRRQRDVLAIPACYSDACGEVGRTSSSVAWEVDDDAQDDPVPDRPVGGRAGGGDGCRGRGGGPGDSRGVRAVRAYDREL